MYKAARTRDEVEPLISDVQLDERPLYPPAWRKAIHTLRWQALLSAMAALLFLLFFRLVLALANLPCTASSKIQPITPAIRLPDSLLHTWAQYSPYFASADYPPPPRSCRITQVNVIQRHGARFPTASAGAAIQTAISKLQRVSTFKDARLNFLKSFTYDLGHDDLVPFGAAQSFDSGQLDFERYQHLISKQALPFVRASSSTRVVQSATNWTAGFARASGNELRPVLDVVLQESLNDTLDDNFCPNAGSGDAQTNTWQAIYAAPIQARLNAAAPGANLTLDDVPSLISLCPFETVAKEKPSAFCSLFTQSDFNGYEYFGDLGKFYGTGYGQELGPVQGVGYVNELLARLTETPVRDNTQTNRTLDASPATFPLDRALYVDFSHDNQMVAIYSALGLFRPRAGALDPTAPDPARTWLASRLVPFSGRLVTERLTCGGAGTGEEETYVRMLVDDALQDLEFCGAERNGLCTLDAFVESQSFARSDGAGDFEKCFD